MLVCVGILTVLSLDTFAVDADAGVISDDIGFSRLIASETVWESSGPHLFYRGFMTLNMDLTVDASPEIEMDFHSILGDEDGTGGYYLIVNSGHGSGYLSHTVEIDTQGNKLVRIRLQAGGGNALYEFNGHDGGLYNSNDPEVIQLSISMFEGCVTGVHILLYGNGVVDHGYFVVYGTRTGLEVLVQE
jgi:hypothetical protein